MELQALTFYILSAATLLAALGVLLFRSPIYSALSLAVTMVGISGLFFSLEAYFLAGVQLIVYAGAVVVMFVMVVMFFDLRSEDRVFSKGAVSMATKVGAAGLLFGLLLSTLIWGTRAAPVLKETGLHGISAAKKLATHLFTAHVFGFELIGVLLLVVLVGAITLATGKGGTHAD